MNRRRFLATALTSGAAAASPSAFGQFLNAPRHGLPGTLQERYAKLDDILQQPVFKRELFKDPVIIQSVELLTRDKQYICRVRSKDGHEGIAVSALAYGGDHAGNGPRSVRATAKAVAVVVVVLAWFGRLITINDFAERAGG